MKKNLLLGSLAILTLVLLPPISWRIYLKTDTFKKELTWFIHDSLNDREKLSRISFRKVQPQGYLGLLIEDLKVSHPLNLKQGASLKKLSVKIGFLDSSFFTLGWKILLQEKDGGLAQFEIPRSPVHLFKELSYVVPETVKLKRFELSYLGKLLFIDDLKSSGKSNYFVLEAETSNIRDLELEKRRFQLSLTGKVTGMATVKKTTDKKLGFLGRFKGKTELVKLNLAQQLRSSTPVDLAFRPSILDLQLKKGTLFFTKPWTLDSKHILFEIAGHVGVEFDKETKLDLNVRVTPKTSMGVRFLIATIKGLGCKIEAKPKNLKSQRVISLKGDYGNHKCKIR